MPLTAMQVEKAKPGPKTRRLPDERGLYLVVRTTGSRSWIQRITIDGVRTDIGLGGYPDVRLARAREKSAEIRTAVAEGRDPRAERRQPNLPTFRDAAEQYIEDSAGRWRNSKTSASWRGSLATYAYPKFGKTRIDRVTRADVLNALIPVFKSKPSIAHKLRQRIRQIFAAAMSFGYIDLNPAGEVIDAGLPKTPAVKSHFRAMPYQDVAATLRKVEASASRLPVRLCFRFLVLTAARSGEARGARWEEIDLDGRTWAIPASRMKAGREHRVPLSDGAVEVLRRAQDLTDDSGLVFPSTRGQELSDMTLTKLLRDNGLAEKATVHGFRTSFKTWLMETTDTPWAVGEAALAHTLGNSTEAAYARSDLFEKRRTLMQRWADYLTRTSDYAKYQAIIKKLSALQREVAPDTAEKRRTPPGIGLEAVLADERRKGHLDTSAAVNALCYLLRANEPLDRYEEYIKESISIVTEQPDQITGRQRVMIDAAFRDAGNMKKPIRTLRNMLRNKLTQSYTP